VRIFLSFNSKDVALAEAIRAGLSKLEPEAKIFFSPVSLGSGLWVPKLADEIAAAEAFLLLIGPQGIGPWQKVEYFTAFDRHVNEKAFALVAVIAAGAQAPGLSFLRSLNWVEAPAVTEDSALHRVIAALKGEARTATTPLWKLVNPYRGLEAIRRSIGAFWGNDWRLNKNLTLTPGWDGDWQLSGGVSPPPFEQRARSHS
jgi:TIR domain-containing protein